jgi:hypothetical protein
LQEYVLDLDPGVFTIFKVKDKAAAASPSSRQLIQVSHKLWRKNVTSYLKRQETKKWQIAS